MEDRIYRQGHAKHAAALREEAARCRAVLAAGGVRPLDREAAALTAEVCEARAVQYDRAARSPPAPFVSPGEFFARLAREGKLQVVDGGVLIGGAA